MQPKPENFEALQRLLVLKKYEQPPPGYFNSFSQQVIVRIQRGEAMPESSFLRRLSNPVAWLQEFWDSLENHPALAGTFGFAVCAVLAGGLYFSDKTLPITSVVTIDSSMGLVAASAGHQLTNGVIRPHPSSVFDEVRSGNLSPRPQLVNWGSGN